MNRDKQIEEMAKNVCHLDRTCDECMTSFECKVYAKRFYNAGYRKASEVAREIIAEIDDALHNMAVEYHTAGHPEYFAVCEMVHHKVMRPIEKKYAEEEG